MITVDDLFWNASVDELKQGYVYNTETEHYTCLLCGQQFEQGKIYTAGCGLTDARKAVKLHLISDHPPLVQYLLDMDKKLTGLTETQKDLLSLVLAGKSDKEIADCLGTSASTVRNHRFNLRQKEKQAKVFLAMMQLFEETKPDAVQDFISIHKGAKMVDERFAITEKENKSVLENYFPKALKGKLKNFPRKEKRKLIILRHIAGKFSAGCHYTEKEVNSLLQTIYDDYVTLRRYLIEYGFLDRKRDGSTYWVKQ